jgi:hypothetical protein
MGLYVHLTVNPHHITPQQWEQVYQDSLDLLRRFPLPLFTFKREQVHGYQRLVHSTDIVHEANTKEEHWHIIGDLVSGRSAESFIFHRHWSKSWSRPPHEETDALWADEKEIDDSTGNGVHLFGNKTQGYPYHLAILAVGILVENRFPQGSYVIGDIDRGQVENVVNWMAAVLKQPVTWPICLDGERLYTRLKSLYEDEKWAIRRFTALFRGSAEEQLEILLRCAGHSLVLEHLRQELEYYSDLSQLGAIKLCSHFLAVIPEVHSLIELVKSLNKFELKDLLQMLCNHFITIEPSAREPLFFFSRSLDDLMTIEDAFSQVFLTLAGAPSVIEYYIASSELLEIFCTYAPRQRKSFQKIIQTGEEHCHQKIAEMQTLIQTLEESRRHPAPTKEIPAIQDDFISAKDTRSRQEPPLPQAEYIINQALQQREEFPQPAEVTRQFGLQLRRLLENQPEIFHGLTRVGYLKLIYQASSEQYIALCDSAWQAIDNESNVELLRFLAALMLVSENAQLFWQWRVYILEHPQLWQYLMTASHELPSAEEDNQANATSSSASQKRLGRRKKRT